MFSNDQVDKKKSQEKSGNQLGSSQHSLNSLCYGKYTSQVAPLYIIFSNILFRLARRFEIDNQEPFLNMGNALAVLMGILQTLLRGELISLLTICMIFVGNPFGPEALSVLN